MQNKTKTVALMSIYAALYVVLVTVFIPISFGPLQVRIANSLIATIPLFGFAGVLGQTIGVLISNVLTPAELFPFDLLNAIPSFIMSFVVYYIYKKTNNDYTVIVTGIVYSAVIGITVGWMLHQVLHIPLIASIVSVTFGNIVASVLIGWPLFKLLKNIGIHRWISQEAKNVEVNKDECEQEMCCCS
ncbi:MAG: QueT transporter family protein [Candidatus Bathyarchaeota archaeon]|nr:QueT transporter family protein [Candidatus Termiticorpusculum sp.]